MIHKKIKQNCLNKHKRAKYLQNLHNRKAEKKVLKHRIRGEKINKHVYYLKKMGHFSLFRSLSTWIHDSTTNLLNTKSLVSSLQVKPRQLTLLHKDFRVSLNTSVKNKQAKKLQLSLSGEREITGHGTTANCQQRNNVDLSEA